MYARILVIAIALTVVGCGKLDAVPSVAPVSPMKQNNLEAPLVPTPPLPKVAADANPVAGPKPGQVNDHSTPAFKDGGVQDKK